MKNKTLQSVLVSVLAIVLAAVSWITNFGWLRACLTLFVVPFFHAAVFVGINVFVSFYVGRCPKLLIFNKLYILTYLLTNILLPDFGDGAEAYFFFGAVECGLFCELLIVLAAILFVLHSVLCVIQIVMILNEKIKAKRAARKGATIK